MVRSLSALFGLYRLTPGRRIYVLHRVAERAKAKQFTELLDPIQAAIAQDQLALELDARRTSRTKPPDPRGPDREVDRTLVTIEVLVSHFASSGDGVAATLRAAMFPTKVADHVQLPLIEQVAANERVLAILEGSEHASWLDAHGFRALTVQLRAAQDSFAAALHARDAHSPPTWHRVKAARELGQELYSSIVAQIVARFRDDPATRDALLEPIWAQNEAIRAHRRRRRKLAEIDPITGEFSGDATDVEPTDPSEPEPAHDQSS